MKRNKYHNKKVQYNGKTFDSNKECERYKQLVLLEKSGKIYDLGTQVKYELIPAQYEYYERYGKSGKRLKDGKKCVERSVDYYADFVYTDSQSGETIIEDTKSPVTRTTEYIIKRKLMLYVYGIKIREM